MCWNSTSSLSSFIIGYSICLILFIRNKEFDRFYAVFFLWILSVQLFEYFIWIDQECKSDKESNSLNNISNQILCPTVLLQPIILAFLSLYFVKLNTVTKNILVISTIVSFIVLIISYLNMGIWKEKQCSTPIDNHCNSLQWPWINKNTTLNTINYFEI